LCVSTGTKQSLSIILCFVGEKGVSMSKIIAPVIVSFFVVARVGDALSASAASSKSQQQQPPPPSPPPILLVERMTAKEYQDRRRQPGGPLALDRPILILNALSIETCEGICHELLQIVGEEMITVQRQKNNETFLYDCTVAQSLDLMMQSSPDDSIFAFCEGLLDASLLEVIKTNKKNASAAAAAALSNISQTLTDAKEALFREHDTEDWLNYFPRSVKPSDCVVVAGEGATSTLHRDPLEWTGTSICLEGRKIWRFLAPPNGGSDTSQWDNILQSYRLESTAWSTESENKEEEDTIISAGWQSDLSLFSPSSDAKLHTAMGLNDLLEQDAEDYLEKVASATEYLTPHKGIQPRIVMGVDVCSVVQHAGELLLIPPYWYHQTYAPEPSLAVASQRCGSALDVPRVLSHVLSLQPDIDELPVELIGVLDGTIDSKNLDPKTVVDMLFQIVKQSVEITWSK